MMVPRFARRLWRGVIVALAVLAVAQLFLICSPYPWRMYQYLSMPESRLEEAPDWIIVLGGGGIPSESGLIRTYYGAMAARQFPAARVVVALPEDGALDDSPVGRMRDELVLRGVDRERILIEHQGVNTRSQAMEMLKLIPDREARLLLITNAEHVRRAVGVFRTAGFVRAGAYPAYDTYDGGDLTVTSDAVGTSLPIQPVESSLFLRYNIWNNANYLLRSSREWAAIVYYRSKGWM